MMAEEKNPPLSVLTERGSLFTTQGTERKVKLYAVVETELDQLAMLNSGSVLFFSLGGTFFGLAADGLLALAGAAQSPPGVAVYSAAFGVISLTCFAIGAFLLRKRRSVVQTIRAQAQARD